MCGLPPPLYLLLWIAGATVSASQGKVQLEGNRTAVSGEPATLSCRYSLPKRVEQVLWKKTAEQGDTIRVGFYNTLGKHSVEELFRERVSLSRTLGETTLTILKVRTEDEACYTCEFNTYPDGARRGTACLSVYVLPKPEVRYVQLASGVTEANCTAQSRPMANITWDVGGENRTLGPPILSSYDQGDGTTVVTSTLLFQSTLLGELSIRCVVQHPGLDKPLSVPLHSRVSSAMVILLSVIGVVSILLLCLCVCLCKCLCADD